MLIILGLVILGAAGQVLEWLVESIGVAWPVWLFAAILAAVLVKLRPSMRLIISLLAGVLTIFVMMMVFIPGCNPFVVAPIVSIIVYAKYPKG